MHRLRLFLACLGTLAALGLTGVAPAFAGIVFDGSPGTGSPPATLGPYSMTPFAADPQPLDVVDGVDGPTGTISFSPSLDHVQVGNGWATWSNGYGGDVYETAPATTATLTLPAGTSAFYFYAEPDPFAVFDVTATAQDGSTSGPIAVDGLYGAQYFGFYGTNGDRIATITVSSGIDFAVGEFGISGKQRRYVALGDSYSSGEGNPPFLPGTDGPSDYCHRSPQAYSEVLGAQIGAMPLFYACSGAVTSDITSTSHWTEPPQLSDPGVDPSADLLTMTIGGNDAGFADVLTACIKQKLIADAFNTFVVGKVGVWLGLGKDPSCAHSSTFTQSVDTSVANVFWPVKTTYLATLGTVDPVNTSVIAADYPLLFPSSHDQQGCTELSFLLTNDDMDFMNGEGNHLDSVLQEAAAEAGVNFVDVRSAFASHEICGSDGSYLNGISLASGTKCTWSLLGHCVIPGLPIVGSFHPNASGHADGYAASFASYIDGAAAQTPAGFPANPTATPDPPGAPTTPADSFGTLATVPVTSGGADCEGTYQAGQQVQFSGGGFAPGATVQLFVTSPGLGANGELQVASLTADGSGDVEGTVRIPLAAAGFTPSGAAAGMVFLDAIGLGAGGSHRDDLAMVGLAPHSSSCGAVEPLAFAGFAPPVANPPQVNRQQPGQSVPVKFTVAGSNGTLDTVLAPGYPQSTPVSCTAPGTPTSGEPTTDADNGSPPPGDAYNYVWKTDRSWTGCRALIVELVDGSYHRAVFDFGS